jgi:hypothetical protein
MDQLMSSGQYSHLVGQSLLSSLEIINVKNIGILDHFGCHQPYDPPQMTITPFRDPALALMFTGLVNSRIQSRHGNDWKCQPKIDNHERCLKFEMTRVNHLTPSLSGRA